MRPEDAQRKLATAARYREMAQYTLDAPARAALLETAAAFERTASDMSALPRAARRQ